MKHRGPVIYTIYMIIVYGFGFLSRMVPADRRRICFFSYPDFADNCYALYRHWAGRDDGRSFRYLWLVMGDDRQIRARIERDPVLARLRDVTTVVSVPSLRGLLTGGFLLLRSGHVFHTHNLYWFRRAVHNKVVVNLWHGMPLKRLERIVNPNSEKIPGNYALATSPFFVKIIARVFGMSPDDVLLTGLPRTDLFHESAGKLAALVDTPESYRRIAAWMPTYRQTDLGAGYKASSYPILSVDIIRALDRRCREANVLCLLKVHPMERINEELPQLSLSHVRVLTQEELAAAGIDTYEILGGVDRLVSDYSSIAFDFALLGRPMGFYVPDEREYSRLGFIPEVWEAFGCSYPGRVLPTADVFFDFIVADDDEALPSPEMLRLLNDGYPRDRAVCENVIRALGLDSLPDS